MNSVALDPKPAPDRSASSLALGSRGRDEALGTMAVSAQDPQQVLTDPVLGAGEKREVLAAWASDACAVENLPNWRRLPQTGALVPLDDILDALQALDGGGLH